MKWKKSPFKQGLITVDRVKDTLLLARGDLFLTACYLDVRPGELDNYIRASDEIQGFVAAIDTAECG